MTIASAVSKATLNGNGSTTAFPFGFKVWKAEDLEVSITDTSGTVSVVANWSVVLNPSGGGTVTYPLTGSPLPTGHKITIARSMDFLQDVDLVSGTRWDPEVVETALDRATAERQQLKERLDRAVAIPISSSTTPEQFAADLFTARDEAAASAASAATSAATAQVAANSVGVLSASGTLTAGQDTITLPWSYDTGTGNIAVFLGGVKQVRSTLTFLTPTTVQIGAAVVENTLYEVTSVTLSAESVLTGLRDQCAAANTSAIAQASSALDSAQRAEAAAQLINLNVGKFSSVQITHATGQPLSSNVVATVLTTSTANGPLNVSHLSGQAGWRMTEGGTYRVELDLPVLPNGAAYAVISVIRIRSGVESALYTGLDGLSNQEWRALKAARVEDFYANDDVVFRVQLIGAAGTIHSAYGRATITKLR